MSITRKSFLLLITAEHLLNQTMIRMFGCERSRNAHIERKKSKISFILDHKPSRKEEKEIEDRMNQLIAEDLPVTYEVVDRDHIPADVKLDRLPADASRSFAWCVSATMMSAPVLENMYVPPHRLASL